MRAVKAVMWTMGMLRKLTERLPSCRTKLEREALAADLGVTYYAMQHRVRKLKLYVRAPWTPWDDSYMLRSYDTVPVENIARWVGRAVHCVRKRVQHLRRKNAIPT